jgi:hypothetical protein
MAEKLLLFGVAVHVAYAVQHATLALAAVGSMMGLVRPVKREIKLMTSVRIMPKA